MDNCKNRETEFFSYKSFYIFSFYQLTFFSKLLYLRLSVIHEIFNKKIYPVKAEKQNYRYERN